MHRLYHFNEVGARGGMGREYGKHWTNMGCLIVLYYNSSSEKEAVNIMPK
jgi:hypothetical protein